LTTRIQIGGTAMSLLLRGPFQGPLERVAATLGHRFPYTLRGRGALAFAIGQRHRGPFIARLRDNSLVSVPPAPEGATLFLLGSLPAPTEQATTLLFERVLRDGDVVLDVGANLGFYTFLAARLVAPQGRVYAFEPQQSLVEHLNRSVRLNDYCERVVVVPRAVVEEDRGPLPLFFPTTGCGSGDVSVLPRPGLEAQPGATATPVVLDEWMDRIGLRRVDVIKIDIEGAELSALRGSHRLLDELRPRLLVAELGLPGGAEPAGVADLLAEHGYVPRRILPDGSLGAAFTAADLQELGGPSNVAFVPEVGA
jgi:FkbM family methyltransferase